MDSWTSGINCTVYAKNTTIKDFFKHTILIAQFNKLIKLYTYKHISYLDTREKRPEKWQLQQQHHQDAWWSEIQQREAMHLLAVRSQRGAKWRWLWPFYWPMHFALCCPVAAGPFPSLGSAVPVHCPATDDRKHRHGGNRGGGWQLTMSRSFPWEQSYPIASQELNYLLFYINLDGQSNLSSQQTIIRSYTFWPEFDHTYYCKIIYHNQYVLVAYNFCCLNWRHSCVFLYIHLSPNVYFF